MSNLFTDACESGDWEPYFQEWLSVEPPENLDFDINDLSDEEIDAMEQEFQDKEFFKNHPSLSVSERNPNLT